MAVIEVAIGPGGMPGMFRVEVIDSPAGNPSATVRLPRVRGSQASQETRAALWTEHTLAQTRIESLRAERDDARRNALDEAIAPLLELAAPLRTGAQRDALAACVIRKLHSAWNTRKPPGSRE